MKTFFLYGSFCQGYIHHKRIEKFVTQTQKGKIFGSCFCMKSGYPGVLLQGNDLIAGELVELDLSEQDEVAIDELIGFNPLLIDKSQFLKKSVKVFLENGTSVEALTYVLNAQKSLNNFKYIDGGDWKIRLDKEGTIYSKLSEKQIIYIKKLGRCTGRDSIPIDLPLYRELIGLELIIDKGRRLALSQFGQEVFTNLESSLV